MEPETSVLRRTQRRYLRRIALTLRPNTVTNARSTTNGFIRYLESEHPEVVSFSELERSHGEGWLHHLASRSLRTSTRRNAIIKVRGFLQSIQEWGWKDAPRDCVLHRGDLPAEEKTLPRALSQEVDSALQETLRREGGLIPTALLFLRVTGLRCQEILDLEVNSLRKLSGNDSALHVPLGKLHSERVIPLDSRGVRIFQELLDLRGSPGPVKHPETGKRTDFLLMRPSGGRITREALRYHLRRVERIASLREHPTPHRLRHTFATEMVRAGMQLPVLMRLLGHRSIGMTLRYVKLSDLDVQRAYAQTIGVVQERYSIPVPPPVCSRRAEADSSPRESLLAQLGSLASAMESFRRDHTSQTQTKTVQRLVERLRRLTADFDLATS